MSQLELKLQELQNKVDMGQLVQCVADAWWRKAQLQQMRGRAVHLCRPKGSQPAEPAAHVEPAAQVEPEPEEVLVWDSYYFPAEKRFQDQARRSFGQVAGGGGRGSGRKKKPRAPEDHELAETPKKAKETGQTEAPQPEAGPAAHGQAAALAEPAAQVEAPQEAGPASPREPAAQAEPAPTAETPQADTTQQKFVTPTKPQRQGQLSFAASPPQSAVEAAMSSSYVPGRLFVDKLAFNKRQGGRPSTGKTTGRHSVLEPESKSNKKGLATINKRRDATASERLHIGNVFRMLGAKSPAQARNLGTATWQMLVARFGRSKAFLRKCLARREEYQREVAEARLGKFGLRPFGSVLADQKRRSKSLKARIDRSKFLKPADGTKKEPLRGVLFQLQKFLDTERQRRNEVRPTHIRTRFTAQLKVEKDVQVALRDAKSQGFQPYVLKAVEDRLQAFADPLYDRRKYERTSVWPKIGGRARFGQKLCSTKNNPDKGLCLLGWATHDHAQWLVANGSQEQLTAYVRDPEKYQKNRKKLKVVQFDQTGFWGKLRGEEASILAEWETRQNHQNRQLKRWMREAETHEDQRVVQAMIDALQDEMGNRPVQHRQLFSQGGDKHRWTVLTNLCQVGWFDPDCAQPRSEPLRYVLLTTCSRLCRVDYITDQHTWSVTHQIRNADGTVETRSAGQSTNGLLRTWVELRIQYPDHDFWKGHTVWGQHSAWCCKGVATMFNQWLGEPEQCPDGALSICDCLAAQWSPEALFHAWDCNIFQIPISPGATAYLQGPDTQLHSGYKASGRSHKCDIEEEGERACAQAVPPVQYEPNWGPAELMELLTRMRKDMLAQDAKRDMCLTSGCSNQTFIHRPDHDGVLRLIDDQAWASKYPREPPGKGIAPLWAKTRIELSRAWPDGVPPVPDWGALDTACYLEVDDQEPEPADEDIVLDFRLQDIDVTPEQRATMLPVEARILELEVPAIIRDRQLAMARTRLRHRARRSQWSTKLGKRYDQTSATLTWRRQIAGQDAAELRQSMLPQVSKSKHDKAKAKAQPKAELTPGQQAAKRQMSGDNKWVRAARQRLAAAAPAGAPAAATAPATGEAEAAPADAPDHAMMGQAVRVTSENAREDWIGQTGVVTKVTQIANNPAQLMILTDEDAQGRRVQVMNLPETYVQIGRGDVSSVKPAKLSYHEFGPIQRQAARWSILGNEPSNSLEEVQPGQMLEQSTMNALIVELTSRLPDTDLYVIWPTEATALGHPDEPDESIRLQLATVSSRLQWYLHVAIFAYWPQHYTLVVAQRPVLETEDGQPAPWIIQYYDPLPIVSQSNYLAAQRVARRIGVLPEDSPLPAPSNNRFQKDGWSCGLWCIRFWEEAIRQRLGEPRTPVMPLSLLWTRGNAFIDKIKKARADPPKPKAPAAPAAPKPKEPPVQHPSLQAALHAAHQCTKCRPTMAGTKGCSVCMGQWFDHIRQKRWAMSQLRYMRYMHS